MALLLASGCGCARDPDAFVATLAGADATDCGRIGPGLDDRDIEACVARAFEQHRAFHAGFGQQGIDSVVVDYYVGDRDGRVWFIAYDSRTAGSPPTLDRQACTEPHIEPTTGELECTRSGPLERLCE